MTGRMPVFVVDDSHKVQSALKQMLEAIGAFEVVGTASGETQATDWLHKHRQEWGVAVLDLLLVEGSGFGLVQRCRSENPNGRIVVFSEFVSPALKTKCIQMGADAVFKKSELSELVQYLEGLAPCPSMA